MKIVPEVFCIFVCGHLCLWKDVQCNIENAQKSEIFGALTFGNQQRGGVQTHLTLIGVA